VAALVGIDIGTQSLKAVVCGDDLTVLGEAAEPYGIDVPRPGWAEQDPRCWEAALAPAIGRALEVAGISAGEVAGIGVAGQLDGCVGVRHDGTPTGPCLIWMDRRATDELPALPAAFARVTGQIADAGHMAAKIRWIDRRQPGVVRFHQPVSYLVERLTGVAAIDHALASTTMLYDLDRRGWSPALLAAFGIAADRLPTIAAATAVAGPLHEGGAALTGLRAGAPVAVGTGDDFATPLGAGLVKPGRVACVVGTAEVVGALAAEPVLDPGGLVETHAYPAGGWFIENPGWMSGGAITWLGELLGGDAGQVAASGNGAAAAALDEAAAAIPAGADGLVFLPALSGAMTPEWHPGARAAFYGLTPIHGRGHLVRAVLEAMAHACRDIVDRLAVIGVPTAEVLLLGGGGQSRTWARIRADVTGRPQVIAARSDTCASGAAMLAAVAAGIVPDLAQAAAAVPPPAEIIDPRPANRAAHDEAYERYRALFDALRPLYG